MERKSYHTRLLLHRRWEESGRVYNKALIKKSLAIYKPSLEIVCVKVLRMKDKQAGINVDHRNKWVLINR